MKEEAISDITIIGGGPVGLFAAFYAGLRQAKTKLIESLPILGGQPNILYPEKEIYDIPGHPTITGSKITKQLIQQLDHFDQDICLGEKVQSIQKKEGMFQIQTPKQVHYSKTIIITVGQGAFKPRKLPFDYPAVFEDHNLHYVVKDRQSFAGKNVAVFGGGDSAVDWALSLEPIAKQVYLVHRRPKFRAMESSVQKLQDSGVEIITPFVASDFQSKDGKTISATTLTKARSDETFDLPVDAVIVNYGFVSSLEGIDNWQVDHQAGGITVDHRMATSQEGIFAAGDVASYKDKIKLIAVGFGEAPIAVNHAIRYINPDEHLQPILSTSLNLN